MRTSVSLAGLAASFVLGIGALGTSPTCPAASASASPAAGDGAPYPKERTTEFVIEKLDITSLPSAFRPKKEKGKKTLADYGFSVEKVENNEATLESMDGVRKLRIQVLDLQPAGIYACVEEPGQTGGEPKMQRVILLKRKNANVLLKGSEASRQFASCPVTGGEGEPDTSANAGG